MNQLLNFLVLLLKVVKVSSQQLIKSGQLTLDDGETLLINTTEPSAVIVDSKGNRTILTMFTENNSFTSRHGNLRKWQYGVARLVVEKDVTFTSNSNVSIYGENALSIASAAGNIIIKTNIVLSCDVTVLGGNCVGGYMPGDKPNNWFSTVIPGNGPGGTSLKYLDYWSPQCIGGSGHGGRGGNPALPNFQVGGYSGLEYGQRNTQVLVGGSSGSYIEKAGYEITKPGHGGGAVQFVAKQGSIVIGTNYLTSLSFLRYYVYYKSKLTTLANRSF